MNCVRKRRREDDNSNNSKFDAPPTYSAVCSIDEEKQNVEHQEVKMDGSLPSYSEAMTHNNEVIINIQYT